MIKYAYKYQNEIKIGILNSDDEKELEDCVPKGSCFWNLNKIELANLTTSNYSGIGTSKLMLMVANDAENS